MSVSGWTLKGQGRTELFFVRSCLSLMGTLAVEPEGHRLSEVRTARDESRKIPREEGQCSVGECGLDFKWRRWNEDAETYLKRKEGVIGKRTVGGDVLVGRSVTPYLPPRKRGWMCPWC